LASCTLLHLHSFIRTHLSRSSFFMCAHLHSCARLYLITCIIYTPSLTFLHSNSSFASIILHSCSFALVHLRSFICIRTHHSHSSSWFFICAHLHSGALLHLHHVHHLHSFTCIPSFARTACIILIANKDPSHSSHSKTLNDIFESSPWLAFFHSHSQRASLWGRIKIIQVIQKHWMMFLNHHFDRENPPPPGRGSYLLCSLIKNRE